MGGQLREQFTSPIRDLGAWACSRCGRRLALAAYWHWAGRAPDRSGALADLGLRVGISTLVLCMRCRPSSPMPVALERHLCVPAGRRPSPRCASPRWGQSARCCAACRRRPSPCLRRPHTASMDARTRLCRLRWCGGRLDGHRGAAPPPRAGIGGDDASGGGGRRIQRRLAGWPVDCYCAAGGRSLLSASTLAPSLARPLAMHATRAVHAAALRPEPRSGAHDGAVGAQQGGRQRPICRRRITIWCR